MALLSLAAPAAEPLTLAEAKAWLRLDTTDDDAVVTPLISAARQAVEAEARVRLVSQKWRWILDAWPRTPVLRVPFGPLRSVDALRVYDAAGVATTLPTSAWLADTASLPSRIALVGSVPAPGRVLNGIEIDLTVGIGVNAAGIPEPLKQAVRLTLAYLYENRGDASDPGAAPGLLPIAAQALAAPWRVGRM